MEHYYAIFVLWGLLSLLRAQDSYSIPNGFYDPLNISQQNVESESIAEAEPINFTVRSSSVSKVLVNKPAPFSDLPPVVRTINVTMQVVDDPQLAKPEVTSQPTRILDAETLAAIEEFNVNYQGTEILQISATVYDQSCTLLKINTGGEARDEITAWSNINFNHFPGISTFRVTKSDGKFKEYALLMGLGNASAEQLEKDIVNNHVPELPDLPDVATSGPYAVMVEGKSDGEAHNSLIHLHNLYHQNGDQMVADYLSRKQAIEEQKEEYLANPPQPKDVTIRFWKRTKEEVAK